MDDSGSISAKVPFYNLEVNVLDRRRFFDALSQRLMGPEQSTVNFVNAHCFNIAQTDPAYKAALDRCTFLLNDGVGIDIAGRLIGVRFPENLNGTDLIPDILDLLENKGMSVFFFGARRNVIERAVENIRTRNPRLQIAGFSDGYIDNPLSIVEVINSTGADAVILGLGVPLQELWVASYAKQLTGTKLLVSGGAVFDFISRAMPRAPVVMRKLRLEWLFRLIQEPRRMFSRYVLGSIVFLSNILKLRPRRYTQ